MGLMKRSLVIRADASEVVGTGHVYRCLALADEARMCDWAVAFICRAAPGHLGELLAARGYRVHFVDDDEDWEVDARAASHVLRSIGTVDWLVVDHYGLDARWESAVRAYVDRIAVFDDLANRPHASDLLVDSSHDPAESCLYRPLTPSGCRLAIGLGYVPLRREFFERRPPVRSHHDVRRILVTLGGNDPLNATELALDALNSAQFAHIQVDVTLGTSNPRLRSLQDKAANMPNVNAYVQHSRMVDLMEQADLCLGAGGTTAWERCYMGLPALVLVLADNQRDLAAKLDRLGCARNLGFAGSLDVMSLRAALFDAVEDSAWRQRAGLRGKQMIDGGGVSRLLALMSELHPT
ncbi:UDP-2,4-diacetamido-2,4,6-trideoxy-beta-L-altropyranose hydrolase [Bordetella genomosp. 13]|uniref:UDP-2,4-diacetamido-2,4, 6-trideoxy-beta-L-altropyranose hydrolase n=1 Tax=Bordetella genomosp. 13 TaxID=463040 RepID=A0A1W6ZA91_9BORD|nr:UDP-2,4-diacetamido-2,4,6-trideoxy-beta-L-altropyranose hydrolase [Bordetella genomosp. 13]ARP94070.1 UDP-2,4-diacetamido-2,4,6-trideoxy-beta-L-altropyranose hydrolase [Bordetella genomosp. 13]